MFWKQFGHKVAVNRNALSITIVNFVALMPIVLSVSALSYYCVERPFLNLRGRYVAPTLARGPTTRSAAEQNAVDTVEIKNLEIDAMSVSPDQSIDDAAGESDQQSTTDALALSNGPMLAGAAVDSAIGSTGQRLLRSRKHWG